jgi:phosphoglycolate phosphatase-like HAD superfamily hydrolase
MTIKCVILDFDGTLTNAEEEGKPFWGAYLRDVAKFAALKGMSEDEVSRRANGIVGELNPAHDVWLYDGRAVAPATVDPYLRVKPVAHRILREQCATQTSDEVLDVLLQILFEKNYPFGGHCPRAGASELLSRLQKSGVSCHIVTNASTAHVERKLERLLADDPACLKWCKEGLRGDAVKYIISPMYASVPEKLDVPGLENRGVLLRRQRYHNLLQRLRVEHKCEWNEMLVVGDVFELDLALPLHIECEVALMANEHTPPYEIKFLRTLERAHVCNGLEEVLALIFPSVH